MTTPAVGRIVTLGFGKANYPETSVSLSCQKVDTPFVRTSAVTGAKAVGGRGQTFLAGFIPHHGSLYQRTVELREGDVVLLQSQWMENGVSIRDGAIFLRLRDGAPNWEIRGVLPTLSSNALGRDFVIFVGDADLLGGDEVKALGFTPHDYFLRKFMEVEEIDECFTVFQVRPSRTPRPVLGKVRVGSKTVVAEMAAAPVRRMTFRG